MKELKDNSNLRNEITPTFTKLLFQNNGKIIQGKYCTKFKQINQQDQNKRSLEKTSALSVLLTSQDLLSKTKLKRE